jgi:hypothetical protein
VCDGANAVVNPVPAVAPGGSLKICIHLPSSVTGVTLSKVYEATLTQPGGNSISSTAVHLGTASNSFTSTDCPTGILCTVQTTVVGAFFVDDTLGLTMTGSVLMKVGRRMLEIPVPTSMHGARGLGYAEAHGNFDVAVPLAAGEQSTSSASDGSVLFAAATLLAFALV